MVFDDTTRIDVNPDPNNPEGRFLIDGFDRILADQGIWMERERLEMERREPAEAAEPGPNNPSLGAKL